jgi:hypothetical protein
MVDLVLKSSILPRLVVILDQFSTRQDKKNFFWSSECIDLFVAAVRSLNADIPTSQSFEAKHDISESGLLERTIISQSRSCIIKQQRPLDYPPDLTAVYICR